MSVYKRTKTTTDDKYRYLKDNKFIKESSVPMQVKTQFDLSNEIVFDDTGEKRCLFGDAHAERIKHLNNEILDICEWHYQNSTLGAIAHQVQLIKEGQ